MRIGKEEAKAENEGGVPAENEEAAAENEEEAKVEGEEGVGVEADGEAIAEAGEVAVGVEAAAEGGGEATAEAEQTGHDTAGAGTLLQRRTVSNPPPITGPKGALHGVTGDRQRRSSPPWRPPDLSHLLSKAGDKLKAVYLRWRVDMGSITLQQQ